MDAQTIMKIINRLTARRDRQEAALNLTRAELENYEAMLNGLKKGK